MDKISEKTSITDVIAFIAEENPGAITVLASIYKKDALVGLGCFIRLITEEIHGSDVWIGYKDVCKYDLDMFISLLGKGELKQSIEGTKK